MKEILIIYRDWWEAIKGLPTDLQLDAFHSICEYAFEGKEPENPMLIAVTALMRSAIDRDKAKWNDVREKRRAAGQRGLQKRWGKNPEQETGSKEIANDSKNGNCYQMPTPEPPASPHPSTPEPTEELTKLEKEFDAFRQAYPGSKRGLAVEFGNFKKKYPKKWKEIIPLLKPALERLLAHHRAAEEANKQGAKIFIPNFAYLATWINNARWEEELPEITIPGAKPSAPPTVKTESKNEPKNFGGRKY